MNDFLDKITSVFAPLICKGCGKLGKALCDGCFFYINNDLYEKCIFCKVNLTEATQKTYGNSCENHFSQSPFSRIFVVGQREDVLKRLVGDFKYFSERSDAKIIAKLIDARVPELESETVVTYITTSAPHIRERGFDHAQLIAQIFAKKRGLKCMKLLKRESSDSQHNKNAHERKILAKKLFSVSCRGEKIPQKVILIDDIWTTGATSIAAAKLLKNSGVKSVSLVIVAVQDN